MTKIRENHFKLSIFLTGFTGIVALIIFLRTFFLVYQGNELVIGIVIAIWFLVMAAGIFFGKRFGIIQNQLNCVFISHLLIGILPLATLFLTYFSRYFFFPFDTDPNLLDILLVCLTLLIPLCFLMGFIFSFLSFELFSFSQTNPRKGLWYYSTGTLSGSILSVFFIFIGFNAFGTLKGILAIHFLFSLFLVFQFKSGFTAKIVVVLSIISAGILFLLPLKQQVDGYLFRNQDLVLEKDTPFGSVVVTQMVGNYTFFENGIAFLTTSNIANSEEKVHYAMLQHPNPESVLIISGGFGAVINEALKYDINSLDYFEPNPGVFETGKRLMPRIQTDPKINIFSQDPRLHLRNNEKVYDIILINLPDPVNTQINRYYTLEFFEELKEKLNKDGVVSMNLSSTGIYLSEEAKTIHSTLYSTLKLLFTNVIIIPGLNNYFIASDGPISSDISFLADFRKITNTYVNPAYLDDNLIKERRLSLEKTISEEVIINYDFLPVNHLLQIRKWTKDSTIEILIAVSILLVFLALIFNRMKITDIGLFTSGFTVAALQIVLFIALQITFGYIYHMIGIFALAFIAGIMGGGYFTAKAFKPTLLKFSIMQYVMGILAVITPLIIMFAWNMHLKPILFNPVFILFCLLSGLLMSTHTLAGIYLNHSNKEKMLSNSFNSGIIGAGVGALVFSLLLIPYFGLIRTGLMLGIINFLTGLLILMKTRKPEN